MLSARGPLFKLALCLTAGVGLGRAETPKLVDILAGELDRNFAVLRERGSPPAYFIAYSVTETDSHVISASAGALETSNSDLSRALDVTVRVGSPELDNYHEIAGQSPRFTSGRSIALEDDPNSIRQDVWRETDRVYRLGAQRLIRIQTDRRIKVEEEDSPPDFSTEESAVYVSLPPEFDFSREEWEKRLRSLSSEFRKFRRVVDSGVSLMVQREVQHLVNSEGSRLVHGGTAARISIRARAKSADGMDVGTTKSFEAFDPAGLPDDETIRKAIHDVASEVTRLMDAPLVDPYVAPAILSGPAAGVFFHEIFGHRVEGHRLRDASEGQTFGNSLNTEVLPNFLSVVFDPTRRRAGDTALMGWYEYDDEGVRARPVPVVENGVMKTFLMSRAPAKGLPHSNGHGRRQPGREVVSRQSNLIVESSRQVSSERLRERLIEEVQRAGKEYGLYFEQVTGGYTQTGRRGLQAFTVIPLVVYRVYPDGRPDELVRGADIVGTPLAAFSKIIATGSEVGVFNGYCGAESGDVPVAAVSPALLVSEIEIQRKESSQDLPPLLPPPTDAGGAE